MPSTPGWEPADLPTDVSKLASSLRVELWDGRCVAFAVFGSAKREWLERFLDLARSIPSHDRFNPIFAGIKGAEFQKCLLGWITAVHDVTDGQVVAIDGETLSRNVCVRRSTSGKQVGSTQRFPWRR